jgi:hypothetical protein
LLRIATLSISTLNIATLGRGLAAVSSDIAAARIIAATTTTPAASTTTSARTAITAFALTIIRTIGALAFDGGHGCSARCFSRNACVYRRSSNWHWTRLTLTTLLVSLLLISVLITRLVATGLVASTFLFLSVPIAMTVWTLVSIGLLLGRLVAAFAFLAVSVAI